MICRFHHLVLFGVLSLTLGPTVASADDFAPPPWLRTDPFAVAAEWEFFTPPAGVPGTSAPYGPDGPLTNVGAKGSGSVPTFAIISADGWGLPSPDLDDDGGVFFVGPGPSGDILFRLDNVIDLRPVKHLRMQVTHSPGMGFLLDPLPAVNAGATGSTPTFPTVSALSAINTLITWDMFPNPPWEDFRLLVFNTGEIDQVLIDTISIPEPSTFVLCGIGLLSLVYAARRRQMRV